MDRPSWKTSQAYLDRFRKTSMRHCSIQGKLKPPDAGVGRKQNNPFGGEVQEQKQTSLNPKPTVWLHRWVWITGRVSAQRLQGELGTIKAVQNRGGGVQLVRPSYLQGNKQRKESSQSDQLLLLDLHKTENINSSSKTNKLWGNIHSTFKDAFAQYVQKVLFLYSLQLHNFHPTRISKTQPLNWGQLFCGNNCFKEAVSTTFIAANTLYSAL